MCGRAGHERIWNVCGLEAIVGAAVGEETALARRIDERDQPAGRKVRVGRQMRRHARRPEPSRFRLDVGRPDPADEVDGDAEGREPRRLVGRRAARRKTNCRPPVGAAGERPLGPHDDVGHHVADQEDAGKADQFAPPPGSLKETVTPAEPPAWTKASASSSKSTSPIAIGKKGGRAAPFDVAARPNAPSYAATLSSSINCFISTMFFLLEAPKTIDSIFGILQTYSTASRGAIAPEASTDIAIGRNLRVAIASS